MLEPREPITHDLKIWPEYFEPVARCEKTFEIRKWDRPYRVGDTLWLREWDKDKHDYTGRSVYREITYLLDMTYFPGDMTPHFASYVAIGMKCDLRIVKCGDCEHYRAQTIYNGVPMHYVCCRTNGYSPNMNHYCAWGTQSYVPMTYRYTASCMSINDEVRNDGKINNNQ